MTITQCPECLTRWTAPNIDEILSNKHRCPSCKPRCCATHPDTELIDWLQSSPNPNLDRFVNAWRRNEGGVSIRSVIRHCMSNPDAGMIRRFIKHGYRLMFGSPVPVPCATQVEYYDKKLGKWIYIDRTHPDSVLHYAKET